MSDNDVKREVEAAGSHPLLTDAVVLLSQARDKVADYVDLNPTKETPMPASEYPQKFPTFTTTDEPGFVPADVDGPRRDTGPTGNGVDLANLQGGAPEIERLRRQVETLTSERDEARQATVRLTLKLGEAEAALAAAGLDAEGGAR